MQVERKFHVITSNQACLILHRAYSKRKYTYSQSLKLFDVCAPQKLAYNITYEKKNQLNLSFRYRQIEFWVNI